MQIKVKPPIEANCNQFILRTTVGKIKKGSYPVSGKLTRKLSIIESTLGPYYMDHTMYRYGQLGPPLSPQ